MPVSGTLTGVYRAHIGNMATVANCYIVDKVANVLYKTFVTYGDISQCGIVQATLFHKAVGNFDSALATSQLRPAVEGNTVAAGGIKSVAHHHLFPIFALTAIGFHQINFCSSQFPVIFHPLNVLNGKRFKNVAKVVYFCLADN